MNSPHDTGVCAKINNTLIYSRVELKIGLTRGEIMYYQLSFFFQFFWTMRYFFIDF